jgi:hypothetical protein
VSEHVTSRLLAALGGSAEGWHFTGEIGEQDPDSPQAVACACGHRPIRYLYHWQHADGRMLVTGSVCVETLADLDPDGVRRIREAEAERRGLRVVVPDEVRAEQVRVAQDCDALAVRCREFRVATRVEYAAGGVLLKEIRTQQRAWDERLKAITGPMREAEARTREEFRPRAEALEVARRIVERALADWDAEQKRIAEAVAEAERKRLAEEERLRREAEAKRLAEERLAEKLRLAREKADADRLAEEARKAAAEAPGSVGADFARMDADVAAEKAAQAEADAKTREAEREAAEAIRREQAERDIARVKPAETTRLAGVSYREVWRFEVMDAAKVPREFLCVDEKAIGAYVRAKKGAAQIAVVRVWCDRVAATSAA